MDYLGEMAEFEANRRDPRRPARSQLLAGVTVLVSVVAVVAFARWWAIDDPPESAGGGWSSDDMESITISSPFDRRTVFRCEPGTITAWFEIVAPEEGSVFLESVEVPLLDDAWKNMGWSTRASTEAMRERSAAFNDLVEFDGVQLDDEPGGWLRMRLSWEVDECTTMEGFTTIDRARVTYRNENGRTRTADIEIVPLTMTTLRLEDVADQVSVSGLGE